MACVLFFLGTAIPANAGIPVLGPILCQKLNIGCIPCLTDAYLQNLYVYGGYAGTDAVGNASCSSQVDHIEVEAKLSGTGNGIPDADFDACSYCDFAYVTLSYDQTDMGYPNNCFTVIAWGHFIDYRVPDQDKGDFDRLCI